MRFKRFTAGIVAAVMAVTAVATPLGDNLPAVRDSVSLTASAAVSASKWGTAITNKNDSRVSSALNNITSQQKNISSTVQSGKSVKDMIYYLVFESEYAVYGGKTIPNNHCNANADGGTSSNTFAEERVYGYKIKMATTRRGCYWYAGYISNIIYGKDGAGDSNSANIICRNGGLTSSSLKSFIVKYLQAGEHIRMESSSNSPHSISYISYDANGFYYLDYLGYKNENAGLRYITYDKFVSVVNSYNYKVYVYNANATENNSSTPTPSQSVTDHYKLTSPDGYQTIRKEASTSSANLGSINTGNIVCVTKYNSDNKWGYVTYNGISGWIRLYYVEKTGTSHSYGSWYTKKAATCTSGGVEERKCSCGKTETRSTSALGHNFGTTYFEAAHPHKYAHLCQRCGYKEFTGGNLDYYEKCDTCNKPEATTVRVNVTGNCGVANFEWTATNRTEKYVLKIFKDKAWQDSAVQIISTDSTSCSLILPAGYYEAYVDSCNGSIYTCSNILAFTVLEHDYTAQVVKPTYTSDGYTEYTCLSCGDNYISDYTAKLTLAKVTNFKVKSLTSTNVTLQWTKNSAASGYEIEQYQGGKWTNVAKITSNATTSYTVKGLAAGTAGYQFRIRAYRNESSGKVYSGYSSTVKVNTNPYGVGGFKCSSKTSTSVTLKWNKGTTASGYQLQQYKNGKWVTIYTGTKATSTSYTVKNLKAGTAGYRFRIRAYKTYGNTKQYGSWSNEVKVNTNPYGVGGFKVKSTAKNSITLGWNKGTTASGYQLQQYKGGKWVTVYTGTKATSTSCTIKSLKANTSYKFRIRAYKIYGSAKQYGSWSKELTVKTKK